MQKYKCGYISIISNRKFLLIEKKNGTTETKKEQKQRL